MNHVTFNPDPACVNFHSERRVHTVHIYIRTIISDVSDRYNEYLSMKTIHILYDSNPDCIPYINSSKVNEQFQSCTHTHTYMYLKLHYVAKVHGIENS